MACNKAPHTESGRGFQWIKHPEELEARDWKLSHSTLCLPDRDLTGRNQHYAFIIVNQSRLWIEAVQCVLKSMDLVHRDDNVLALFSLFCGGFIFSEWLHVSDLESILQGRTSAEHILNATFIRVPLSNNAPLIKPKKGSLPNVLTLLRIWWFPEAPFKICGKLYEDGRWRFPTRNWKCQLKTKKQLLFLCILNCTMILSWYIVCR